MRGILVGAFLLAFAGSSALAETLTLEQAEAAALQNQPRLRAAQLRAAASGERVREARSGFMPQVGFNATGVRVSDAGTSTAAGNITTSAVSDRFAYGGSLTQLVTDFGRTGALVASARSGAEAERDMASLTRAEVRLRVRDSFYQELGAEAVLRAAKSALGNRQLVVKQLRALAENQLRSTLDVHFAEVLESEAELAVVHAESAVAERRAALGTAMGAERPVEAELVDVPVGSSDVLPGSVDALLQEASGQRADLNAAHAEQKAAEEYASAEKKLSYPTLNVLAAAGQIPFHDRTLQGNYAAAGFNLNIPVWNGGLFGARRREAELTAHARAEDARQMRLSVGEEVRAAFARAVEAQKSVDVSARLVAESKEALRLAEDRYSAGLGNIVELNEAQLNETSAEIEAADAAYTYLTRRAELDFADGGLN